VAVLLRVGFLFTSPSLSDDVFRYVWDGKLLNLGVNPYSHPPSAPELTSFRDPLWERINHKSMATPYPPLAEALFAMTYRVAPDSVTAMQALAVAFDLSVVVLLLLMLSRMGLDRRRVLIYAWNPLVLLQFGHSAHYDAAMLLPLLGAIYLLDGRRIIGSGALLATATLVKMVPALLAPLFLPLWGWAGLLAMVAVSAAGLLPWIGAAGGLAGLVSEATDARFNDSLGYLFSRLLQPFASDPDEAARGLASTLLALTSLAFAGYLWRHGADWRALGRWVYRLLGLFLLLNAVVEPWYLTWMVPFLCFLLPSAPNRSSWLEPAFGWLLLSGLVVLTDLTYLPEFAPASWAWVRAAEYGPLYLALGFWCWRALGHYRQGATAVDDWQGGPT
jgi:hypothetical protein